MKLTNTQKRIVRSQVRAKMSAIFSDFHDLEEITSAIVDEVIEDIEDTADWSDLADDEVCIGDINIGIARVVKILMVGED